MTLSFEYILWGPELNPMLFQSRHVARLILATPLVYVSGLSVAAANGVPWGCRVFITPSLGKRLVKIW